MICHRLFSDPFQDTYDRANSNLVGQIYCTFSMGKPMIVYNNVLMIDQLSTFILSTAV